MFVCLLWSGVLDIGSLRGKGLRGKGLRGNNGLTRKRRNDDIHEFTEDGNNSNFNPRNTRNAGTFKPENIYVVFWFLCGE